MTSHSNEKRSPLGRHGRSHRLVRIVVKWIVFAVVTLFVLFPYPGQLVRHLRHLGNLEAMVAPHTASLARWDEPLQEQLEAAAAAKARSAPPGAFGLTPREVQKEVERFVLKNVRYRWDWESWGSADYMPTVEEMFAKAARDDSGQVFEDCDGRAVMAASLMRRLGFESRIVTDLRHVWVTTDQGDWMGPGGRKTIRSSRDGNQMDLLGSLENVPISLSYGVAVFPLWRELIILATAALLTMHRRMSRRGLVFGLLLMLQGLLFLRCGYIAPSRVNPAVQAWPAYVGVLHLAVGLGLLIALARRARRGASPPG